MFGINCLCGCFYRWYWNIAQKLRLFAFPKRKVHVANMGPIWGRQVPGGPYVGPIKFAVWADIMTSAIVVPDHRRIHCCLIFKKDPH